MCSASAASGLTAAVHHLFAPLAWALCKARLVPLTLKVESNGASGILKRLFPDAEPRRFTTAKTIVLWFGPKVCFQTQTRVLEGLRLPSFPLT